MANLSFFFKTKYNLRLLDFKLINKIYFQLLSVHGYLKNHLHYICEVMEGD